MDNTLKDNTHTHRFEMTTDGLVAFIEYQRMDDGTLALVHTEVDPSQEGQGVGSKLVEEVLTYVERNNLKVVPACPFIATYIKRHPDWNRVVSTTFTDTGF